ncbi:NAD(P)-dependent dehydrogenase, short-chain alcohol dehydrogenase family [Seinonella peptonophila]|uniref:NAD(P)-dependent dehydrogenase, short-chain alcohol dehydrogenase family n=1 Tax=Seinonella peptonophila TaxID=112248 RepID=A0A1M4Y6Z7_9BACL|nr:glucose 1-dehydrogenase [Seinonella peptonophila]SHF01567.1 NAD(P)-dependent dehydrogenase, short-chain alcohol dehydrogenase family [Seinonella peptonophila]
MPEFDEVFSGVDGKGIFSRYSLAGRVSLVTGGGQGIGRAFAHALGEAGSKVAIIDMSKERAEHVVSELHEKKIEAIPLTVDVRDEVQIKEMIVKIIDHWGKLDIAFNNAGINKNAAAEETKLKDWDATFSVNLRGMFLCCQAEGRVMLQAGYGKIINTASMSSIIVPHPQKQAAYNTSKAGVVQLTKSLAAEWADRGVRVNCLSPGIIHTDLLETEELKPLTAQWIHDIPMHRLGEVTDLQGAAVFLASSVSDYMTGHNLIIDGGQTLW